ncbi:hypothetical protein VTN00DRAFT_3799 [Thermoascus crustaceus]|uniref:uncharacterized protein n=1 Tax=Thermoascus crustaceus TaxID=5088 RepID=UPI0037443230
MDSLDRCDFLPGFAILVGHGAEQDIYSEESPEISFCAEDGRAFVRSYADQGKFRVGDPVLLIVRQTDGTVSHEGPYLIETVASAKTYTLCLPCGQAVGGRKAVKEEQLKPASK